LELTGWQAACEGRLNRVREKAGDQEKGDDADQGFGHKLVRAGARVLKFNGTVLNSD
jgi:hypothetical protein